MHTDPSKYIPMRSQREIDQAATLAVKKVFAILGVDIDQPNEIEEFRETLRFSKRMRRAADKGSIAFIVAVITAFVSAMGLGIVALLRGHP